MSVAVQQMKFVSVTPPAAIVDNAAYTTAEVDTKGWAYCTYVVYLGATDIAMAVLKVTESDASGSGHADITGLDTDGDTNYDGGTATLPTATDDNGIALFHIDLRGRKRYLDISATAGDGSAGTFAAIIAILSRGEIGPDTMAEMGAFEVMMV